MDRAWSNIGADAPEPYPDSGSAAGWVSLIVSLLLLGIGVDTWSTGPLKFSVSMWEGGIPASLAKNLASSESLTVEPELMYEAKHLEQMLVGRKNPTFNEPSTLIERLVFSIFSEIPVFALPPSGIIYRLIVHKAAYSLLFLFVFIIAVLSGSVGLTKLVDSSYPQWMGLIMSILLLIIWEACQCHYQKNQQAQDRIHQTERCDYDDHSGGTCSGRL